MKNPMIAILMRTDLNTRRGKMVAQGGHAINRIRDEGSEEAVRLWKANKQIKIVLAVDAGSMGERWQMAKTRDLPVYMIRDAGKTEVEHGTVTCIVIGIAPRKRVQKVTSGLKALR